MPTNNDYGKPTLFDKLKNTRGNLMKSTLSILLLHATSELTVAMVSQDSHEPKPTGRNTKSKEQQEKAILAAQVKRARKAAKRLGKS